jgi:hypothetical protein
VIEVNSVVNEQSVHMSTALDRAGVEETCTIQLLGSARRDGHEQNFTILLMCPRIKLDVGLVVPPGPKSLERTVTNTYVRACSLPSLSSTISRHKH